MLHINIVLFIGIYVLLLHVIIGKLSLDDDAKPTTSQCPRDHFLTRTGICQPYLGCHDGGLFELKTELQVGYVKRLFIASWEGMEVMYSIPRHNFTKEDFIHGVDMLRMFQYTRYVPQLIGFCTDEKSTYLATKFHKYGSAEKLKQLLDVLSLPPKKELHVRVTLTLDYLSILSYLHNSPIGTRVMCDSNDLVKTLSQFLITDDLHLVVADLDALPEVNRDKNISIKCGHKQLFGSFIAPEQRWPYTNAPFDDAKMPGYDEKTDIWKVPNVLRFLLGQSNQANQLKFRLFEVTRLCKQQEPSFRPDARYVREAFIDHTEVLDMKAEL